MSLRLSSGCLSKPISRRTERGRHHYKKIHSYISPRQEISLHEDSLLYFTKTRIVSTRRFPLIFHEDKKCLYTKIHSYISRRQEMSLHEDSLLYFTKTRKVPTRRLTLKFHKEWNSLNTKIYTYPPRP